jgi:ribosomal protein S18 acetylase RimI-like enzyme
MAGTWVRAARAADAAAVADIQVRVWRRGYQAIVPPDVLAEMTGEQATAEWRRRWSEAVTAAPSPRHRLLVAVEAAAAPGVDTATSPETAPETGPEPDAPAETVAGFAAHGPATDPDLDPRGTGELLALLVDPGHERHGHGSRLLAATVDHLRDDGYATAVTWVFEGDTVLRDFLGGAGWASDGATRALDMGRPVPMLRMHTTLVRP